MKRTIIIIILLFTMLMLTACGQSSPAFEPQQDSGSVQIPNPWRDITETEAKAVYPQTFTVPDNAENAAWRVMESAGAPALLELDFELNGLHFTARQQQTGTRDADLSGMYYTWTAQDSMTLCTGLTGTMYRCIDEDGYADLCIWYDEASGVSYSLGVTAKDLDGFDLQAVAEALFPVTPEEQRTEEHFNARDFLLSIPGTWQTASVVSEEDGTAHPEYYVRFTDSEILYGHMKDGAFVIDHTDTISRFEKTAAGGFKIQAEAANGEQYSFQTSQSDNDVLEYFETWNEAAFSENYRGGSSLSRCILQTS